MHSPEIPQEFPRNSPEIDFEIWGIRRNVVLFSTGTNIKHSTDSAGCPKTCSVFMGNLATSARKKTVDKLKYVQVLWTCKRFHFSAAVGTLLVVVLLPLLSRGCNNQCWDR